MKSVLSFDDVLLQPKFSLIESRKDVDVKVNFLGISVFPVISSNMDSVTEHTMANAMSEYGGLGALHRFCSISDNMNMYRNSHPDTIVSLGLGDVELDRALALYDVGASRFLIDVAHGASMTVVDQTRRLRQLINSNASIIVGNFANGNSLRTFLNHFDKVDALKIGVGSGGACTTRIVTGCGLPTFQSIIDCGYNTSIPLIADGGIKNSGDFAKALAAGATAVMIGGLLAGTTESPGAVVYPEGEKACPMKEYRGSASAASYAVQSKTSSWRTPEGESFLVPHVGTVKDVLQKLESGLRSSMSYVGATNLNEFHMNAEFVQVSTAGNRENGAHGKGE